VLQGLGTGPIVGGDDQHHGIDLAGTDQHVPHQAVVAGHIHEVKLASVGQHQVGVADIDGHAPALLLGQAVGVDAGQRP